MYSQTLYCWYDYSLFDEQKLESLQSLSHLKRKKWVMYMRVE